MGFVVPESTKFPLRAFAPSANTDISYVPGVCFTSVISPLLSLLPRLVHELGTNPKQDSTVPPRFRDRLEIALFHPIPYCTHRNMRQFASLLRREPIMLPTFDLLESPIIHFDSFRLAVLSMKRRDRANINGWFCFLLCNVKANIEQSNKSLFQNRPFMKHHCSITEWHTWSYGSSGGCL